MRAILLASATAASFGGLRFKSSISQRGPRPRRLRLLHHRGRPDHQQLAQSLIARAGDLAEPGLSGGGMVFGVRPSQAANSRPERNACGSGVFITSACGGDRTNTRDLRQAPAQGIGAVPGHKPGLDRLQLRPAPVRTRAQALQTAREPAPAGFRLARLRQQRRDLVQPLGFNQAKLRRVAADRIAQLGAAGDQLLADARTASAPPAAQPSSPARYRIRGRLIASHSPSASRPSFLLRGT